MIPKVVSERHFLGVRPSNTRGGPSRYMQTQAQVPVQSTQLTLVEGSPQPRGAGGKMVALIMLCLGELQKAGGVLNEEVQGGEVAAHVMRRVAFDAR